ncbi:hypothetical protein HJ01_03283 [Flavobacterium frigoris PS1]|uniref:Uncharacterized protein n=1 Tax=Flavobacterium frigoris (strain PS1) TaxID=1086011 RepID=H7FVT5_FLAFP|nr:hypothetical protein HJ01_03283 [Flavobacterium frigoris PS1]
MVKQWKQLNNAQNISKLTKKNEKYNSFSHSNGIRTGFL